MKTFRGMFINLANIAAFVRLAAKIAGLNEKEIYQVETAVDEACSNIIEHAYSGEDKGDIICCCDPEPGCLTITLKDTGRRFDPSDIPLPDTQCCLEDREPHGLGLYFINQLMDEVAFDFSDPKMNVLVMTKRKE
ncbi:MAG: ATP-binding protein [Anaerolineaceae bacterium]